MSEALASPRPDAPVPRADEPLVRCEDLAVRFVGRDSTVHAVNGVNFALGAGEVLCIVGESGSGKTVALRAMMRLLPARLTQISGKVTIAGKNVMALDRRALGTPARRRGGDDLPGTHDLLRSRSSRSGRKSWRR